VTVPTRLDAAPKPFAPAFFLLQEGSQQDPAIPLSQVPELLAEPRDAVVQLRTASPGLAQTGTWRALFPSRF
jgi:hypothetical protein